MSEDISLIRAVTRNFEEIIEGSTVSFMLDFLNDDKTETDITGWAFNMRIKPKPGCNCYEGCPEITEIDLGQGLSITPPNVLSFSKILPLHWGNYVYQLTGTDQTGVVTPWLRGTIKIDPSV